TPILARLHKEVNAPENETAVGRNFEREYTITVEVAPDEDLSNLTVTDLLPDNIVITEIPEQGDWTFSLNRSGSTSDENEDCPDLDAGQSIPSGDIGPCSDWILTAESTNP